VEFRVGRAAFYAGTTNNLTATKLSIYVPPGRCLPFLLLGQTSPGPSVGIPPTLEICIGALLAVFLTPGSWLGFTKAAKLIVWVTIELPGLQSSFSNLAVIAP
jgi:hypothetical protein